MWPLFFFLSLLLFSHAIDQDILRQVEAMPLEQKVGQMLQLDISVFINTQTLQLDVNKLAQYLDNYYVGSILDSPCSGGPCGSTSTPSADQWKSLITQIQNVALSHGSRIPILYGLDTVHGANYIKGAALFPQPIGLAATFNRTSALLTGQIGGKDTRSVGIPWVFSPILGLASHQAWPRYYETFGEDPFLVTEQGVAIISGYQRGGRLNATGATAACMKHYIGYPLPRNGLDRGPVWIPDRKLYGLYAQPFTAAVRRGQVASAMSSYNELNGEAMATSSKYLSTLLRQKMGFSGLLVTDYQVIHDLVALHRVTPTVRQATAICLNQTTVDMSMSAVDTDFFSDTIALVKSGALPESRLDSSVARILQLKKDVGVLTNPYPATSLNGLTPVGDPADYELTLEACRESVTLLQNDGLLPLNLSAYTKGQKSIVVTGPNADSLRNQAGGWTIHWQGPVADSEFSYGLTVLAAIRQLVSFASGEEGLKLLLDEDHDSLLRKFWAQTAYRQPSSSSSSAFSSSSSVKYVPWATKEDVADADVVVAVLGEDHPYAERLGNTLQVELTDAQTSLLQQLVASGKDIVVVLLQGRPQVLPEPLFSSPKVRAVINGYLPGPMGGPSLAEVLFGLVNPSGRLPFTYPKYVTSIPIQYWHSNSFVTTADSTFEPKWAFGTGLSYSKFVYSNLRLSRTQLSSCDATKQTVVVSVDVTNTGPYPGQEVVLLFVKDEYRIVPPEDRLLRGFEKLYLAVRQTRTVQFVLTCEDLAFYGFPEDVRVVEAGDFTVFVGGQTASFQLTISQPF